MSITNNEQSSDLKEINIQFLRIESIRSMDLADISLTKSARSLLDLAAEAVGKVHRPETIVGHELALDENMFKRVLYWSFPQNLAWLELMKKDKYMIENLEGLYCVAEIYQIGFYLTAKLEKLLDLPDEDIQVHIEFERQTPLSFSCSKCSQLCGHVKTVMAYRITVADQVKIYLPLPETLMKQDAHGLRNIILQLINGDKGTMLRRYCVTLEHLSNTEDIDGALKDPTVPEVDCNDIPKILQDKLGEFESIKDSLKQYRFGDRKSSSLYSYVNKLYQIASICGVQMANSFAVELIRIAAGVEFLFHDVETNLSYFVRDVINVLLSLNLFNANKDFKLVDTIHEVLSRKANYQHMISSLWVDIPLISPIFKDTVTRIYSHLDMNENDPLNELAACFVVPHIDIHSEEPLPIMLRRAEKTARDALDADQDSVKKLEAVEYLKKILIRLITLTQNHSILSTFISLGFGYSGNLATFISELKKIWTFSKGKEYKKTRRRKCPPRIGISIKKGKYDYSVRPLCESDDADDGDSLERIVNYLESPLDLSSNFEGVPRVDMGHGFSYPTLNNIRHEDVVSLIENEIFTTEANTNALLNTSGNVSKLEKSLPIDSTLSTFIMQEVDTGSCDDTATPCTSKSGKYIESFETQDENVRMSAEYSTAKEDEVHPTLNQADGEVLNSYDSELALNIDSDMSAAIFTVKSADGKNSTQLQDSTMNNVQETALNLSLHKSSSHIDGANSAHKSQKNENSSDVSVDKSPTNENSLDVSVDKYKLGVINPENQTIYEKYQEDIEKENLFVCFVHTLFHLSQINALLPEGLDLHTSVIYQLSTFLCLEMSRYHHDTSRSDITEDERKMFLTLESGIQQQVISDRAGFTPIYLSYRNVMYKILGADSYGLLLPYALVNTMLAMSDNEDFNYIKIFDISSNHTEILEIAYTSMKTAAVYEKGTNVFNAENM